MAIYARVSTADKNQTVENQLRDLLAVAARQDWEIVATFCDEGISGSKGRDKRPAFDALLKGVARKDFDLIACFSVCRIGRSLTDLIHFLGDVQAKGVDLYVHAQGLDTSTPSGALSFQLLSVFSSYERAILRERILSGLRRTTKKSGRRPMSEDRAEAIKRSLLDGSGVRATARFHKASTTTVTAIKRSLETVEGTVTAA